MSTTDLPDDPSQWPDDPYALLGVTFGVQPRDLKRAYTRLIRRFKPEQFPEQFRRIRAAYEAVLRHSQFFRFVEEPEGSPADPATGPPQVADPEPPPGEQPWPSFALDAPEEAAVPAPRSQPSPPSGDDPEAAWDLVLSGDEAGAYRHLLEVQERVGPRDDVCMRLYWLLVLAPEVDRQRSACDWLVRGLRSNGLTGPLCELLRRAIAHDPAEGVHDRLVPLLEAPVDPNRLIDLLDWRWQAAERLGHLKLIPGDLERLRDRCSRSEGDHWPRLLLGAVHRLAWARDDFADGVLDSCIREIKQFDHSQSSLADEFERLDFLPELRTAWLELLHLPEVPAALVDLIPLSWTRPFAEYRSMLLAYLHELAAHPTSALGVLSLVQWKAPAALSHLGRLLLLLQDHQPGCLMERRSEEMLTQQILDFLDTSDLSQYPTWRLRLLRFCIGEAIDPEWVAAVLESRSGILPIESEMIQTIRSDWPLRYVCLAHRLFWA